MKNIRYVLPVLFLFFTVQVMAQHRIKKPDPDKIKAYKIAFITEKLNFTEKEAEKFWPVYNLHEKQMAELRNKESGNIRKLFDNKDKMNTLSESEAKQMITSVMTLQEKAHALNKEYHKKIQKILPYKKILQLYVAEREFKRELFHRLKRKRRMKEKQE